MPEVTGIDHIYLAVRDLAQAERFYDQVLGGILGFRKNRFALEGDPHVQFYNRHFGLVLRPAVEVASAPGAPGLHHLCLRVDSIGEVREVAASLRATGIAATEAEYHPEYAPDYWAVYFSDPDGNRLEITNYRAERRERHDRWTELAPIRNDKAL